MPDEYIRDPTTGREFTRMDGDYTFDGNVEVKGNLTKNGQTVGGGGSVSLETPTGAVDGVNKVFVFSSPPIFVVYQGIIATLGVDYALVGSTATFVVAPVSGLVQGLVSA